MPNFVQMYKSTDLDAPVLTGQAGSMIALLNAVLVNGYTTASLTSITRSGTTATATLAVANSTMVSGHYRTISGAVETAYNGVFQVTVVNSTTFTYTVSGSPTTPATGTILHRRSPLAWASPFTGTNKAVYRSANTSSNRFFLRILETGGTAGGQKECAVWAAESMSDVDTGTNLFPTAVQLANGVCWPKSGTADATARAWTIIGDDKAFYVIVNTGASITTICSMGFGHVNTFKAGDGFNTFIAGQTTFNSNAAGQGLTQSSTWGNAGNTGLYLARSYTQTGGSTVAGLTTTGAGRTAFGGFAQLPYPHPVDNGLYVAPAYITEAITGVPVRGRLPGYYDTMHLTPLSHYDQSTGVVGLSGATLVAINITNNGQNGQAFFDITGPW